MIAFLLLAVVYLATLAPDLTFWDASEFITAAQTLGVPHPPGTPLWTLLGHVSAMLFSATGPVRSVNTLSALATAGAFGIGAAMATRWVGMPAGVLAAVSTGGMMTIWSNATETEVYAVALLLSVAMLGAGVRAGESAAPQRWRALIAYLAALSVPTHLSAMVALPAAIAFAWAGPRPRFRDLAGWVGVMLLAASAVAVLPLLSMQHPALDSGHPDSLRALVAVLRREQFDVPGLWPRTAPLWLQFGNMFEWADWQVAFGLHPHATPSWRRTLLTLLWTWLAGFGLYTLWRRDGRVGRAMLLLLISGTFGVAVWLNMRTGPTFGGRFNALGAAREARERDYFFVLGYWAWGMLAGIGIAATAAAFAPASGPRAALRGRVRRLVSPRTAVMWLAAALVAAIPLVANWTAVDRRHEPLASLPRVYARLLLDAVPQGGVLFAAGDNDTFPLWYLQQVEDYRSDVTVVTVPLLGAATYRAELARGSRLLDSAYASQWPGLDVVVHAIAERAAEKGRPYRVSTLLAARDRRRIDPARGWMLQGLVYAPSAALPSGQTGFDDAALAYWRERVPPSALRPLPPSVDGAGQQMQSLLRCALLRAPETEADHALLVSACNGT